MAEKQAVGVPQDAPANMNGGQNDGGSNEKSFNERLNEIPMYTMSLNQLYSVYASLRERNEVLKKAFDVGEYYAKSIANTAKPVVMNATNTALAAAKPVIGEVKDPGAALDSLASKTLAEVEKKFPVITKTPSEIAETTKEAIKSKATSCMEKLQGTAPVQMANKQVENVISLSELMVEICFPTDGACPEDLAELDREEESEHQDAATRIGNLKDKLKHRGTRKLMKMKPVVFGVDAVHYAQQRIEEMNVKLEQGTNYMKEKASEAKTFLIEKKSETEEYIHDQVTKTNEMLKENANKVWDNVYSTTMYIPSKAIKVSGEVFVSTKEIVFAYSQAHSITELPHAIVEMVDKYYASLRETAPQVTDAADKAVAFVVVPAQVVAEYLLSTRPVQWVIPSVINADEVKIMEDIELSELEQAMTENQ